MSNEGRLYMWDKFDPADGVKGRGGERTEWSESSLQIHPCKSYVRIHAFRCMMQLCARILTYGAAVHLNLLSYCSSNKRPRFTYVIDRINIFGSERTSQTRRQTCRRENSRSRYVRRENSRSRHTWTELKQTDHIRELNQNRREDTWTELKQPDRIRANIREVKLPRKMSQIVPDCTYIGVPYRDAK